MFVLNLLICQDYSYFFQTTPNLRQLDIVIERIFNGQEWENIIENHLTKLKVFRLQMQQNLGDSFRHLSIAKLADSFRNPFWIDERQWFIRCFTMGGIIFVHTLPSTFQYFYVDPPETWKTTSPYDDRQQLFDNISGIINAKYFERIFSPAIQMFNLRYLHIRLPIPDNFWTAVPSLTRLDYLSISSHNNEYRSQLQALLDRAIHLRSLHIEQESDLPLQTALFTYTNASVRRFQIQGCRYYFTSKECQQLILSPIESQCDVLSVIVQDRRSIVYLVKKLINLRLLFIRCKDDRLHPTKPRYETYDREL